MSSYIPFESYSLTQFIPFLTKDKLSYSDLNQILITSLSSKHTWNATTLKRTTAVIWQSYKDRLSFEHKAILKAAIKKLRTSFSKKLVDRGCYWLHSFTILDLYKDIEIEKMFTCQHRRKMILLTYAPTI